MRSMERQRCDDVLGRRATPLFKAWTPVKVDVKTTTPAVVAHSLTENMSKKVLCGGMIGKHQY
jgi:hypothetical protein